MKKSILIFAIVLMGLTAYAQENNNFGLGQQVMLPVKVGNSNAVSEITGTDDGTQFNFRWKEDAQILVIVGTDTATFTLQSGAGTDYANFFGQMPGASTTFDILYPATTPDLATQNCAKTDSVPVSYLTFSATGCTLNDPIQLKAKSAVLQLNLYGTSQTISQIVVTNISSQEAVKPTYTLNINPAITLTETAADAKVFFITVPAGAYKFSAEVFNNASTPASICKFTTSTEQTFGEGSVLNMPAKKVQKYMYLNELFADEVW